MPCRRGRHCADRRKCGMSNGDVGILWFGSPLIRLAWLAVSSNTRDFQAKHILVGTVWYSTYSTRWQFSRAPIHMKNIVKHDFSPIPAAFNEHGFDVRASGIQLYSTYTIIYMQSHIYLNHKAKTVGLETV